MNSEPFFCICFAILFEMRWKKKSQKWSAFGQWNKLHDSYRQCSRIQIKNRKIDITFHFIEICEMLILHTLCSMYLLYIKSYITIKLERTSIPLSKKKNQTLCILFDFFSIILIDSIGRINLIRVRSLTK